MTYMNMARKYRPQTFNDVAAQSHITETLRRALQTDRVASAYLFTGPRGSGKTTVARLLAKAVNCNKPKKGEPCTKCESCEGITSGRNMDVLEIDGASNNSVDDIRELRENVRYAASEAGKRKVYIIDEVHMLSTGAFNALLKTLEEPPPHVLFVFATTEAQKVPATILSRCQRFDFRRLTTQEIHERLKFVARKEKELDVSAEALFVLAKRADGSLRDALSLLDQVQSSTQGRIDEDKVADVLGLVREEVYLNLSEAMSQQDAVRALQILHEALQQGADPAGFVLGLLEHMRNLLLLSVDDGLQDSVQLGDAHLKRAQELAATLRTEDLLFLLNRTAAIHEEVRRSSNPVVLLESAMVELARFESRVLLKDVLERLEEGGGGAPTTGGPRSSSSRGGSRAGSGGSRRRASAEPHATGVAFDGPPRRGPETSRPEIAVGGPPTLPSSAPMASAGGRASQATAMAQRPGFGEPQVIGAAASEPAPIVAESTAPRAASESVRQPEPAVAPEPVQDFDSHLDGAFDDSAAAPAATLEEEEPPAVTTFSGTLDLQSLSAHWPAFTEVVRGSKAMLAHCLSEGRPQSLTNGVLALGFSEEHAFHLNLMREPRTQRDLETQLEQFFGTRLKVSLSDSATPAAAAPAPATPGAPEAAASAGEAPIEQPERTSARLTPEDVAQSRRDAAEDALQQTPRLQDILDTFDGEILEDNQT